MLLFLSIAHAGFKPDHILFYR